MSTPTFPNIKLGVLGGGQLGKMLAEAAHPWHQDIHVLDQSTSFPAGGVATTFTEGDFTNYDDVLAFGKTMDLITIEIEKVNVEALYELEKLGKKVYPQPRVLDIIRDKRKQKAFYLEHNIPTAPFREFEGEQGVLDGVQSQDLSLPFVQKAATGGYDGRGVQVVRSHQQLEELLPGACLVEQMVPIEKELAVVVARRPNGQIKAYPCVEMVFHPTANLVEWLACPARIPAEVEEQAKALAIHVAEAFDIVGLLAVEL
ncbi:MAG: ATP-grasp domain-containing protein, partial [Bacteroidota bacterium]